MWTDAQNHDSDTRDPNALDVIVGPGQTQSQVLDWRAAFPTRVPMVRFADTTAPTVTATRARARDGVYRSAVTVTLAASDDFPGTVGIEYRLNAGPWTAYAQPFTITPDATYTLDYRATDASGNVATGTRSFTIDKPDDPAPPSTAAERRSRYAARRRRSAPSSRRPRATTRRARSPRSRATSPTRRSRSRTPAETATGRLVNGTYALSSPLQVRANGNAFAPVGAAASPTLLLTYAEPVTTTSVTVDFRQSIPATETLRAGNYGKTLTFTLSTTTP